MSEHLPVEQQATNYETMRHIEKVRNLLNRFIVELLKRGELHDQSKLESPEVEAFTKHTPALAGSTYGGKEYTERCKEEDLAQALDHHYARNRHHPQHFKNGINEMNLIDILEMFIDWKAASERHHDGNIRKSIEINGNKYSMSPQLVQIFENTADWL